MLRRRGGPGLLSTMARTAVIAGTATATSNAINRRGAARAAAAHQAAVPADVPAAPEAPGDAGEMVERLQQLAKLRESGMLTEEEFAAAKARLLAG